MVKAKTRDPIGIAENIVKLSKDSDRHEDVHHSELDPTTRKGS